MRRGVSFWLGASLVFSLLVFAGCVQTNAPDAKIAEQTATLMNEANRQAGLPNIVNFQQKKLMKMVYELADKEDLLCYVYLKSDYTGKLVYIGKSIGFGVPFSAQYTNPERVARSGSGGYAILPQPDPNGLFMPTASSATWLLMIDPKTNKPHPVYIEPEIVVSPFPLT